MKVFGSISRLVSILFRKDGQDIALKPNQSTTYSAARSFELPVGDSDHELVGKDSAQALSNKSMDGDSNSFSNIGISSLKTELSDADKVVLRDVSGAIVSSKLSDKHIASDAAIDLSKLASVTASKVLVSDSSGKVSASSISDVELGYLSGVSSNVQEQLNAKATKAEVADLTTDDIAEGSNLYFTDARAKAAAVQDGDFLSNIDGSTSAETLAGLSQDVAPSVQAVASAIKDIVVAIDTVDTAASSAQSELDDTQAGAGLNADGGYSSLTASNYLKDSDFETESLTPSLRNADKLLDIKLKQVADSVATEKANAITAANNYTDTEIGKLVDGAPGVLNTLNEIAAAIGDDANFVEVVNGKLSKPLSGEGEGKYLRVDAEGNTYWDEGFIPSIYRQTWASASGTSLIVSHNLASTDVQVSLIDLEDGQQIGIESISITDSNSVTLVASEAPGASGWRVLIQKL